MLIPVFSSSKHHGNISEINGCSFGNWVIGHPLALYVGNDHTETIFIWRSDCTVNCSHNKLYFMGSQIKQFINILPYSLILFLDFVFQNYTKVVTVLHGFTHTVYFGGGTRCFWVLKHGSWELIKARLMTRVVAIIISDLLVVKWFAFMP